MKISSTKIILPFRHTPVPQEGAPTPKSLSPTPGQGNSGTREGANAGTPAKDQGSGITKQDGSPRKQVPPPEGCYNQLFLLLGVGVLFYFLLIRPQQKQEKRRKAILASVKKGDKIITTGGIHGEVVSLDEKTVTIKFGNDSHQRMTLERAAIGRVPEREAELAPKKGGG
ncbi:MAG TPA: preprotein translocase subunit YajC [Planctomycetes bacterium]|nr:preprotein translocase subunit YajC [Planctomycetota bacterium]